MTDRTRSQVGLTVLKNTLESWHSLSGDSYGCYFAIDKQDSTISPGDRDWICCSWKMDRNSLTSYL